MIIAPWWSVMIRNGKFTGIPAQSKSEGSVTYYYWVISAINREIMILIEKKQEKGSF